jgi:outer membrane receptor protein involved in Fe transport
VSSPLRTACALALLAASAAGAQPSGPDAGDGEPAANPDEVIVFGVRPGEIPGDPTAFGDVLDVDDYTAESKDLPELLSEQAGVFVRRFGGAADRAEVSIRGSTSQQVVVTIDGVRANSALTGGLDLSRVCLPLLSQVGIVRGAGATREGSGAIGGVVDLVTREAGAEPETRVSGSAGSFDTWQGSLFHAGSKGELAYHAGYCGLDTEGDFEFGRATIVNPDGVPSPTDPDHAERINNQRTQHGATLGAGAALGPGRLRFGDFFVHSRGGEPGFDDDSSTVTAGQNPRADGTDWANLAQLRWESEPLMRLHEGADVGVYHRYEHSDFHDPLRALFGAYTDVNTYISTLGGRAASRWEHSLGPASQRFGLELEGFQDALGSDEQNGRDRVTGAGRVFDELSLWDDRVLVVPALRAEASEGFELEWIPGVGAVVSPLAWLRLRANAGRAYRVPNFDELFHPDQSFIRGNPDLDPEDAWNFDAGFELVLARLGPLADARLVASWFRREIDDAIVWVLVSPTTLAPVNTGEATSQGVELALTFRVTDYMRVTLNHTEIDSERDATGERLPGQPERETYARVQLGPPDAWKLVGEWHRTDDLQLNEGGGAFLPDRDVWHASASLNLAALPWLRIERWLPELWVYAAGNNLSDEAVRDARAFPQPGRNWTGGFEARW